MAQSPVSKRKLATGSWLLPMKTGYFEMDRKNVPSKNNPSSSGSKRNGHGGCDSLESGWR
jgi:hypothetical protein